MKSHFTKYRVSLVEVVRFKWQINRRYVRNVEVPLFQAIQMPLSLRILNLIYQFELFRGAH